ncbi:MAG: 3D domain-containing protein [Candidatus Magasanikbacteria bacterium]|jgi:3D (Asp-Asp-Asp) domain-containing protein|nr:3D domain-containing protein [Candidatus Magasanikbacteria bacterium]
MNKSTNTKKQIKLVGKNVVAASLMIMVSALFIPTQALAFDYASARQIAPIITKALSVATNVNAQEVPEESEPGEFPESGERSARYTNWVVATAYSSDPWQTDDTPCTPAMGSFDLCKHYEENGVEDSIANNCLPLGTKVRFPDLYGDKLFTVRDRMNARYGCNRVDFWVGSETPVNQEIIQTAKKEARSFGMKQLKMEVYGRG